MKRGDLDEFGEKMLWISWSRLLEFEKCHQALAFHMEGKGAEVKEGRNFVSGTVADRAMRQWLDQEDGTQEPGQMAQYVHDLWQSYTKDSEEYKVTWKADDPVADENKARALAVEAVTKLEPFLFAAVLPYNFEPEWRFQQRIAVPDTHGLTRSIVLNGGADILVHKPETNEWCIYDLKVTRNENYVRGKILGQLVFYQLALKYTQENVDFSKVTSAFLSPATKLQYHELTVTQQDRQHLMVRILKLAHAMWDKVEPTLTNDKNDCYFCDCKGFCPLWASVKVPAPEGRHRVSLSETANQRNNLNRAPNE